MSSLLVFEVSPNGENSVSLSISKEFVAAWKAKNPEGAVVTHDLATIPIPHLDGEAIYAGYTPEGARSDSMVQKHEFRHELIREITSVDHILISAPMWNWALPSVLKAYIDQIVLQGTLDGSGAAGLTGKKVTVIISQGGSYAEGAPRHGWDFESGYLRLVATALGSTDVEVILAELTLAGIAPGMKALIPMKEASFAKAMAASKLRVVV